MDARANIPVSLPRDSPTQSYWQTPPDEHVADLRTTDALPASADVVIIGSGITGAAVAWGLLEHGEAKMSSRNVDQGRKRSIVMLEARPACSGATGRNGGHTKAASYRTFLAHASEHGTPTAVQIARLEHANIRAVHAFARDHGIDCDSVPCDTIDVVYDAEQWEAAKVGVAALREALGSDDPAAEYTLCDADEVREKYYCHDGIYEGTEEKVYGGVVYPGGSLSAYKFGIGVLKLCLARGLNLQTNTPAVALERGKEEDDAAWTVRTPRGSIVARRVVLATNAYTAHLVPRFQGVIVPLRGQITAQRPGRAMPLAGCLPTTYSFIYKNGYEYMIPRPAGSQCAGDIVIGGGLARAPDEGLLEYGTTEDTAVNERISAYLRDSASRYFGPSWGDDDPAGRVRMEWTGIMGFSPDGFPFVGEMPPDGDRAGSDLWMASAFQGHGMVLCWMCSRALVEMMESRDDGKLDGWFPRAWRVTLERLAKRFQGRLS
ncbi:FAD dependent oxidoreductase [Podospora didyma]|uniref:FAD dependent oxidoreductase n=1 Tax=Podospora didyma TaxID=330526 RepID=A0AAE0NHQ2_9PEZI|nr:FAD dependent oxidoreductase [Podospora didyma]